MCIPLEVPLENVKASRWPRSPLHPPPTALQKVIRDYSSEGKNVIPLIKDFHNRMVASPNPSHKYNPKINIVATEH